MNKMANMGNQAIAKLEDRNHFIPKNSNGHGIDPLFSNKIINISKNYLK